MILNWKNYSTTEKRLFEVISILLDHRLDHLHYIFDLNEPKSRLIATELYANSIRFNPVDSTMIRLALDIWASEGNIFFHEIFFLPKEQFHRVVRCLDEILKFKEKNEL